MKNIGMTHLDFLPVFQHVSVLDFFYFRNVCQRIITHTLVYASGTSGIGCIRFKHGVVRWHTCTSRQKIVSIFRRMVYAKHMLNTLEVR